MKKKTIALMLVIVMAAGLAGCAGKAEEQSAAPAETQTDETESSAPGEGEAQNGMGNPWRDCTEEEAYQYGPNGFSAPEGATDVHWSMMEAADKTALPGTMIQMDFTLDGVEMCAREQAVPGEEIVDISGMYYEWTVEDEGILANWAGGCMPFKSYRYVGDEGYADVILWFDIETGYAYSLSAVAPDLDGFDIQAVAEAIYDPDKQIGANMPDEEDLSGQAADDENSNEAINGYAEETAPSIDITGCDTFTQIVDKKLSDGMGYANVTIGDTDVLLVSSGTFDNLEGAFNAIDAAVFEYKDAAPFEIGKVCSGGTAYPLSVNNGYLYTGSNHWICKYAIADDKLMIMEKAAVSYDTDGNGTYSYESDDGGDYSDMDPAEAEKIFDDLVNEMMEGEVVEFSTVVK